MDPRLLEYYNRELQFVREMGAEFAQQYPRIAARLGIDGIECADPYVERLLEGFAFLAARVQLKIDARHPEFTRTYRIDQAADVVRSRSTPDHIDRLTFRASGAAFAPLFDGQETLLSVTWFPWYVREISVP